ncbi:DoxX family membrane protein [Bacillaceae bacterium S4-13-56]
MENDQLKRDHQVVIPENPVSFFLFNDTRSAWIWLIIRLYLGYTWITSGWGKLNEDVWTGDQAGTALSGFLQGAVGRVETGEVAGWYGAFLENVILPNAEVFSYMVAYGELLVGLGLILGLLTGLAAFFGSIMNASFMFAGTLSSNPLLFILATWLVLAWKVAGWYGLDRWALPKLGTPWGRK